MFQLLTSPLPWKSPMCGWIKITQKHVNQSNRSNMLCICPLSSGTCWWFRYSHRRSVWSADPATSWQPFQAIWSAHHHTEHWLLIRQHQYYGTGQHQQHGESFCFSAHTHLGGLSFLQVLGKSAINVIIQGLKYILRYLKISASGL